MAQNKLPKNFTFIDLFAGIGGFRMGMESIGGKCIWSNDYDKYANITYKHWFKDDINGDDIETAINNNLVPSHDVLCAGFPCQPFSNAGKKQGFDDKNQGHLFFRIMDIVNQHLPKIIFLENVRNIFKEETFKVIEDALDKDYLCARTLINAKGWVPQKRIRAFMLFFRRDSFTPDYVFHCQSHLDKLAARGTENEVPFSKIREKNPSKEEYQIPEGTWKSLQRHKERHSKEKRGFGYGIVDDAKATRTLSARYHKDGAEILIEEPDWDQPRKVTIGEGLKLMGYNKSFAKKYGFKHGFLFPEKLSKAQIYKQLGNSLVPEIVEDIFKFLVKVDS